MQNLKLSNKLLILAGLPLLIILSLTALDLNLIGSYYFFLQSKERAGIERAVISRVFTKGNFTQSELILFGKLLEAQKWLIVSNVTRAMPLMP